MPQNFILTFTWPSVSGHIDLDPVPGIVDESSEVPDPIYWIRLRIVRGVDGLTDELQLFSAHVFRDGKRCLPDGPGPLPVQRLLLLLQVGALPRLPAVYRHIDPDDSATTAAPCVPFKRDLLAVAQCRTRTGFAYCALYWVLLYSHWLAVVQGAPINRRVEGFVITLLPVAVGFLQKRASILLVCLSKDPFTLNVCVCVNVDVESNFNIMLKMTEMQIQRMGHSLC